MCAPRFVIRVMLQWVAMSRSYDLKVFLHAGGTEHHILHLNFTTYRETLRIECTGLATLSAKLEYLQHLASIFVM